MPLVDVEIILKPQEAIPDTIASELADALGQIFGSPRNGTWVKVRGTAEVFYAENAGKEKGVYPVFVTILEAELPDDEAMQTEVKAVSTAVGQICRRPASLVHVIYQPEGKRRVAFGGRIVT